MATGVIPCEPWKRTLSQTGDLNDCLYQGEYLYSATTSHIPKANTYGLCYVHSSNMPNSAGTGWIVQMAYSTTGEIYVRRKINSGGSWTSWSVAYDQQWYAMTTANFVSTYVNSVYDLVIARYGKIVTFNGLIRINAGQFSANTDVTIGTIPVGFRPSSQFRGVGQVLAASYSTPGTPGAVGVLMSIGTNGSIVVNQGTNTLDSGIMVNFSWYYDG